MSILSPCGDRVAVIPVIETRTEWGFELPDHSNAPAIHKLVETLRGNIFALGPKVDASNNLKIGDEVLFFNHNRNKVDLDDAQVIIMPVGDLIGIIEKEG